jgi:cobaltochelatase CobT
LAGEPELEVNFSSEPPALKGLKARLPSPARNLKAQDIALVRGVGDAYALRKAYHDEALNRQLRPVNAEANAVFDAAESARVEAIGALAMAGVKTNLAAQLEQRLVARGLGRARTRDEAALSDVVELMVREALTGEAPPAPLAAAVDLWRPFIQERAGGDLKKLGAALRDQKAFAA